MPPQRLILLSAAFYSVSAAVIPLSTEIKVCVFLGTFIAFLYQLIISMHH